MAERSKREQVGDKLPVNVDAERFVLGSIILDDTLYVPAASALSGDDFSLVSHRRIFSRMAELHERGEKIDRVTVANELLKFNELDQCGGISYLVSLDEGLPQLPNIDAYVRIVKEKSTLRRMASVAQNLMSRCLLAEEESATILGGIREQLLNLDSDTDDKGPQTPEQVISAIGINKFLGPPDVGLPTGFRKYDDMTGGLHPDELTIIAARPSMGKTSLALDIARNVAIKQQKAVAFFSLEMSKRMLLFRMVCAIARVDSQRVRQGYLSSEERRRLAAAAQVLRESRLYIDDRSAASAMDVHARVRRLMAKDPLALVIIDYLQLMSAGRTKFENRNLEVSAISRDLKLLSSEIKAPVIALSQLNRAPETRKGNNRPQLSDLRESGSLEQTADVVAMIFREEMYAKDREDIRGLAELIISKQRNGPTGTVKLVFLHAQTKFENRAEDTGEDSRDMF